MGRHPHPRIIIPHARRFYYDDVELTEQFLWTLYYVCLNYSDETISNHFNKKINTIHHWKYDLHNLTGYIDDHELKEFAINNHIVRMVNDKFEPNWIKHSDGGLELITKQEPA